MKTVKEVVARLNKASRYYYNTDKPIMSDSEFDRLEQWLKKHDPNNQYFNKTGASPLKNEKHRLPILMPGLTQLRPDEAKELLKTTNEPWLVMPKADGYGILSVYKNGHLHKVYTRGDGYKGRDITHLVQDVIGIKQKIKPIYAMTYVKQELIIHKSVFSKMGFDSSPRNVCASIVNRKEPSPNAKYAVAVAYSFTGEVAGKSIIPSIVDQFKKLFESNFITIFNCFPVNFEKAAKANADWRTPYPIKKKLEVESLFKINEKVVKRFIAEHKALDIDCDGIVIAKVSSKGDYNIYKIKLEVGEQDHREATVGKIEWNVTSRKILAPVVVLKEPVVINGVKLSRFYADTAKYVQDNKLCAGAKIKIVRSGDVIPRIVSVLGGTNKFKGLPSNCPECGGKLDFNNVNLICRNNKCLGDRLPRLIKFFDKLKIADLRKGTLKLLASRGYYTIPAILKLTPDKISKLPGFGDKKAASIVSSIKKGTKKLSVVDLMAASDIFTSPTTSLSFTRLDSIVSHMTIKRVMENGLKPDDLNGISGIGPDSATLFCNRLPYFIRFYSEIQGLLTISNTPKSGKLLGKRFVFTGFRDAELEAIITENGATVGSLTKDAHTLYAASMTTEKVKKAKTYGVRIISAEKAAADVKTLIGGKNV